MNPTLYMDRLGINELAREKSSRNPFMVTDLGLPYRLLTAIA